MLLRAYVKRNREYHVQEFLLWYVNPEFLIVLPPANRCLREYKKCTWYASRYLRIDVWKSLYTFQKKRYSGFPKKVNIFLEISGISGNFRNFRNFPRFRGENSGVFSRFQAAIACKHFQNGRFSGDDFLDFPEFPEISGNFPKMLGISPGFRGENLRVFSRFQAVIVYKHPGNARFSGDDFRDFPEFPEFPENFRKIPEFRNFGNPKNSRNFRKFPATSFF